MKNNSLTIIERYTFMPYFSGYYEAGRWYDSDGKQLNLKHYNGCNCVVFNGKKYGIKKLRSFAKKNLVKKEQMPF